LYRLEQLAPELLAAVPKDPFNASSQSAIRRRLRGGGSTSFGPDRADDKGVAAYDWDNDSLEPA